MALATFALIGAAFASPAVARADCGMHQFQTANVPALQRLDAIPATPENVLRPQSGDAAKLSMSISDVPIPMPCSDDSAAKNQMARDLTTFWRHGIDARAEAAAYRAVIAGKSSVQPACYAEMRAATRLLVANDFALTSGMGNPTMRDPHAAATLATYAKTPYYPHIVALWKAAFADVGLTFRGFQAASPGYGTQYARETKAAKEHLPAGVLCPDDPMSAYLKQRQIM